MTKAILVIDDEADLIRLLDYNLTKQGYLVYPAKDGEKGIAIAREHTPDIIILDIMIPGMDGWEVCKQLRADPKTQHIPIIMLTAKAEEVDKVLGLGLGADDYLTKPFSVRELIARIEAIFRRLQTAGNFAEVVKRGTLTIDAGSRKVTIGNKEIELTTTEFNILKTLAEHPGRVISRDDLIAKARGENIVIIDRNIDVHIVALRKKLGKQRWIETVRGVGYRFKE